MLNGGLASSKWYNDNLKLYKKQGVKPFLESNKKQGGISKEAITGIGGMVFNQAVQDISQILAIQGYDTAANVVSWGAAVGGGAITGAGIGMGAGATFGPGGAAVGGWIGAGIGGLIGALGKTADELQKCATEIADAAKIM
jgi:hypothetical protein